MELTGTTRLEANTDKRKPQQPVPESIQMQKKNEPQAPPPGLPFNSQNLERINDQQSLAIFTSTAIMSVNGPKTVFLYHS